MADVAPVVRRMLLCEDVRIYPDNSRKVDVFGLLSTIRTVSEGAFPLRASQLCVYLELAGGRGAGEARIFVVEADSDNIAFTSAPHQIAFGTDPLAVSGLVFRIKECIFPRAGLYWVQIRFDDKALAQEPLLLK